MVENLDEKLKVLYRIDGYTRREMREHFLKYSQECGACEMCLYKHHILEIFELTFVDEHHIPNKRHTPLYDKANQFVIQTYIKDDK